MFDRPKASPPPAYAGTKPEEYATHEARPAHWFAGIDWVAPTWITGIHNVRAEEIRQKVGKRSYAVVGHNIYGDAAGHICIGMVDALQAIEIGGEIAWEGNITRPSNPQSPSYWRAEVNTGNGVFYLYWGRPNQPRDDILLEPLGNANAELEHPAYRGQSYLVIEQLFFGQNNQSIPNIRVKVRRKPKPQIGTFVDRAAPEGDSIVAAMLELLTDPIAGAALPLEWFEASDWENLDLAVSDRAGDFSPHLTRDIPVSTALADLLKHFDGWIRMENGKLTPGAFPHNGNIPADLPTYTEDDFTEKPRIDIPASSRAINAVTVNYRDKDHLLRESSVTEVDGGHIDARGQVQNTTVSLEAVTSQEQAQAIAAEWVASLSDPSAEGTVSIRSPRARHPNGDPLRAGDNFWLSYTPYGLSQLCRVIAITTPFKGSVTIEFKGEPGVFPLPLATADPSGPQLGKDLPQQVVSARIFELPTPLAPNTSTAIAIGVLAMRPQSLVSGIAGLDGRAVIGFYTWYGATDTAYDPIGNQTTWAARATLTVPIADSDTTIAVEWDTDNLDLGRVEPQSSEAQADNTLLLIIDDEIMSVGDINLGTGTATIDVLRGRLSTAAAAHADEAECWLVYRDEITAIGHAQFTAQSSANFKLQPFTSGSALALDQAANIPYNFRDRGAELPQITIDQAPTSEAKTGVPYLFRATITDVNGDIERAEINIIDGDGTRTTVSTVFATTAQGAVLPLRTHIVFPTSGTWTVEVTAWDTTAGVDPQSTLATSPITVTIGSGFGEPDTSIGTPAGLAVEGGFGSLLATWNPVHNANYYEVSITESDPDTSGIPPSATAQTTANSYLLAGLEGNTLRYFQVRAVRLVNGVAYPSGWSTPANGTSAIIIDGTFYSATPPPNPGQDGAVWFDSSDKNRIYRWDASASQWIDVQKRLDASDVGTEEILAHTANIKDGIITDAKIANLTAGKITSGTMETAELQMSGSGAIIRSSNFVTGDSGFRIRGNGDAEFNDVNIRGTMTQSVIILDGVNSEIRSSNFVAGSSGWRIRGDGAAELESLIVRSQNIEDGAVSNYASAIPWGGTSISVAGFTPSSWKLIVGISSPGFNWLARVVQALFLVRLTSSSGAYRWEIQYRMRRGNTGAHPIVAESPWRLHNTSDWPTDDSVNFADIPNVGSHRYQIEARVRLFSGSSGTQWVTFSTRRLAVEQFKK